MYSFENDTVICYTNKSEDTLLSRSLKYTYTQIFLSSLASLLPLAQTHAHTHSSSWATWLCSGKELEQIEKWLELKDE